MLMNFRKALVIIHDALITANIPCADLPILANADENLLARNRTINEHIQLIRNVNYERHKGQNTGIVHDELKAIANMYWKMVVAELVNCVALGYQVKLFTVDNTHHWFRNKNIAVGHRILPGDKDLEPTDKNIQQYTTIVDVMRKYNIISVRVFK